MPRSKISEVFDQQMQPVRYLKIDIVSVDIYGDVFIKYDYNNL